jgi:hypothetical protein
MRVARRLADDVDDAAVAPGLHQGRHGADRQVETEGLLAQLPLQHVHRGVLEGAAQVRAGVVDEDVHAPERAAGFLDEGLHGACIGHVGRLAEHGRPDRLELRDRAREGIRVPGAQRHRRPLAQQHLGDGLADAARPACHQRGLAAEPQIHSTSRPTPPSRTLD